MNLDGICQKIASEINIKEEQAKAAVKLLDDGATVPFIARYRKEATGGLDDVKLRALEEKLHFLRELEDRRQTILNSIREQDKLTPTLEAQINSADTKVRLEDLYLPFRPKRVTKAMKAIEAGLLPLATELLENHTLDVEKKAAEFINLEKEFETVAKVLDGVLQILMEQFAENAELIDQIRNHVWNNFILKSVKSKKSNVKQANKFKDYHDYQEKLNKIPSHRALALFRGRREGELSLTLTLELGDEYGINAVCKAFNLGDAEKIASPLLKDAVKKAWKTKIYCKLELECFSRLKEIADNEAIKVFAGNLKDLLLAAPAGAKVTMGLDPGIRTGVKLAVVDETGKLLDYATVYPFAPVNAPEEAMVTMAKLAAKFNVNLISIGNGTASRETERLVADMLKRYPDLKLTKVVVSEAGASVYSASEIGAQEFPDIDVSIRGAISIARRVQDPLAELVKIEPKSIGVGQYQHDVNQMRLQRTLDAVVEDCVNLVGVDVNLASIPLLARVAGCSELLAKNIVNFRNEHGAFKNREQLLQVQQMGAKTFQQAAGFLRVSGGDNPLDNTGVHPEAYPIVHNIVAQNKLNVNELIGKSELLKSINAANFVDADFGVTTVTDILKELEKPGRDPRPEFKVVKFAESINELKDLKVGLVLEGVVSNVTNFGAFVDVGVHQDGLVHISEMTDKFVADPRNMVKAGDIVQVRIIELDLDRKRINLSMRSNKNVTVNPTKKQKPQNKAKIKSKAKPEKAVNKKNNGVFNTAMADALSKLKQRMD